jgi:hypothetical protein
MPTTATDLRYGRRGGGWLPSGYVPTVERFHCEVCGCPMLVGDGTRHASCVPDDTDDHPVAALFDLDE